MSFNKSISKSGICSSIFLKINEYFTLFFVWRYLPFTLNNSDNFSTGTLNNLETETNEIPCKWGSNVPTTYSILYLSFKWLICIISWFLLPIDKGTISIFWNSIFFSKYFFICKAPPSPLMHNVIIIFFLSSLL